MPESLWGEEFNIPDEKEKTKKIIEKVKKPKEVKAKPEKVLKSKTITLEERLKVIEDTVRKILGKQVGNAIVINTVEEYQAYIDSCIKSGYVAVDTETNNSLDPITCKIMGLCLYTPGRKQAYIPVNHEDYISQTRLDKQLTEEQIADGLRRLIDAGTFVIMHNGKFDYQVIKCTCGVEMPIDWDTMIAYKLIDENEFSVGLKQLYIKLIDPEQEKYSIDHLFEGVPYAFVDTSIFALYSATDALMTYKLYEYEKDILTSDDYSRVYQLFKNIEMPCVTVTAEMELAGVEVDQEYAQRLQVKYHKQLDNLDTDIQKFLDSIKETVNKWRLTPEARAAQWRKQTQNQYDISLNGASFNESSWKNENGQWYKLSKSKSEQLDEELTPDTLASPTQLGIILYDILNCPIVNKDKPYATGSEELEKLVDYTPLCKLMIKRRELVKLLTGYIDTIPELAKRWPDGRVRTHFNQYGAATGRFSSSDPINLQNIPSHNKELRMMFKATTKYEDVKSNGKSYKILPHQEVFVKDKGWTPPKNLSVGDYIQVDDENYLKIEGLLIEEKNIEILVNF